MRLEDQKGMGYPWGEDFDGEKANYCDKNCEFDRRDEEYDDEHALTAPVGSFPEVASWAGALDMAGNVWEWVNDWYDGEYYSGGAAENPYEPGEWGMEGPARRLVVRLSISGDLRSALRRANLPVVAGKRRSRVSLRFARRLIYLNSAFWISAVGARQRGRALDLPKSLVSALFRPMVSRLLYRVAVYA